MKNREQIGKYLNVALADDKESFYFLREKGKSCSCEKAYKKDELLDAIMKKEENTDLYLSLNGFCTNYKRKADYCRQVNGVFIDLDSHDIDESEKMKKFKTDCTYMRIIDAVHNHELFAPTFIVSSGRGLHLYYIYEKSIPTKIKKAKKNSKGFACHRTIQNILYTQIKQLLSECACPLSVDSTKDLPRLSRIPGTYNRKSDTLAEIIFDSSTKYTFEDFGLVKQDKVSRKNKAHRVYNAKSINQNRIELLNALLRQRNYKMSGYRHYFLFAYYNSAVQLFGQETALLEIQRVNEWFKDCYGNSNPISDADLRATIRCIDNNESTYTDEKHNAYSGFYKLKDAWLYEHLGITSAEMADMCIVKTPSKRELEKKQRKNKKEKRDSEIIRLVKAGVLHSEIATKMNLSLKTVQNVLKQNGFTREYRFVE